MQLSPLDSLTWMYVFTGCFEVLRRCFPTTPGSVDTGGLTIQPEAFLCAVGQSTEVFLDALSQLYD